MTVMSDASDRMMALLRRAARRLTLQSALGRGITAGTAVLGIFVVASVASLVVPLTPVPFARPLVAAFGAVALVTAVLVLARPTSLLEAARLLDARARLEERSSTALEVAQRRAAGPLGRRVIEDAARHLEPVNLPQVLPIRLPRSTWMGLALAAVLLLWPQALRGLAIPGTPAARTQETIRREGSRLEQFARQLQSRTRTERAPQTRRVAPQIRELGLRLRQERVDRAEALARVADLSRQIDEARREIDGQVDPGRPARRQGVPQELFRRQALQQQIRQLREMSTRLQQNPEAASPEVLQRLGEISQSSAGDQSAEIRESLQRARENLQRGNAAGAGEALNAALRELEGLESMLADAEGLRDAQQQLQRSQQAIASGGGRDDQAATEGGSESRQSGPGENAPSPEEGGGVPAEGPHEGTRPGQGVAPDKMGAASPRLEAERTPDRLRGTQSEGAVSLADVVGAARPGAARQPVELAPPAIVAQADQAMERARTPGRYRALVRRYFEALSRLR